MGGAAVPSVRGRAQPQGNRAASRLFPEIGHPLEGEAEIGAVQDQRQVARRGGLQVAGILEEARPARNSCVEGEIGGPRRGHEGEAELTQEGSQLGRSLPEHQRARGERASTSRSWSLGGPTGGEKVNRRCWIA